MKDSYKDIRSRIDEKPWWWDVHGAPRYGRPHEPSHLMGWVACQRCKQLFYVSLAMPVYGASPLSQDSVQAGVSPVRAGASAKQAEPPSLEASTDRPGADRHPGKRLISGWGYGDPPIHDCRAGNTMCTIPEYEFTSENYLQQAEMVRRRDRRWTPAERFLVEEVASSERFGEATLLSTHVPPSKPGVTRSRYFFEDFQALRYSALQRWVPADPSAYDGHRNRGQVVEIHDQEAGVYATVERLA